MVYTTAAGSDSDGQLSGSLSFVALNGAIEVIVTNNETGTIAKGQAISAFSFTVSGLTTPTSFTSLAGSTYNPSSGTSWTSTSGTQFTDTSPSPHDAVDHWGFSASGANISLATAGSDVSGATGHPLYMILASSGTAGTGSSLSNSKFDPYVIGPATFIFADAGITANQLLTNTNFSQVSISFGTGPDQTLLTTTGTGTSGQEGVPEPSSFALLGIGAVGLAIRAMRRRNTASA